MFPLGDSEPAAIPFVHVNGKKLMCRSMTAHKYCIRMHDCSYAHTLEEQQLDPAKLLTIQLMLNREMIHPVHQIDRIYQESLSMSRLCDGCHNGDCTGGYNCRNGACHRELLVCCDDIYNQSCTRMIIKNVPLPEVAKRFYTEGTIPCDRCYNGYHLTSGGILSYNEYVRQKCVQYDQSADRLSSIDPFHPSTHQSPSEEAEFGEIIEILEAHFPTAEEV